MTRHTWRLFGENAFVSKIVTLLWLSVQLTIGEDELPALDWAAEGDELVRGEA
jgi:hypothetical protein